jgi:hypothetical protein
VFLEVAERCAGQRGPGGVENERVGVTTNGAPTDFDDGDDDERLQIGAPVG